MPEALTALKNPGPPLDEERPLPRTEPDGSDFPGLSVPPGPRPGMPRNMMNTSRTEYVDEPLKVLAGRLPPDLQGHVFVAGPSVQAGTPALASDGLVLRLDFDGGGARFTNALMRSPSYYARQRWTRARRREGPSATT
ncbi:hypothetical protein ACLESO_53610 [Pyxidicoccus sp. 3LG]